MKRRERRRNLRDRGGTAIRAEAEKRTLKMSV
jgi:hypothetical protein